MPNYLRSETPRPCNGRFDIKFPKKWKVQDFFYISNWWLQLSTELLSFFAKFQYWSCLASCLNFWHLFLLILRCGLPWGSGKRENDVPRVYNQIFHCLTNTYGFICRKMLYWDDVGSNLLLFSTQLLSKVAYFHNEVSTGLLIFSKNPSTACL